MRRRPKPDDAETGNGCVGGDGESPSYSDGGGVDGANDWAGCECSRGVEEVCWAVDLPVFVVGAAGATEAAAAGEDAAVGHEEGYAVVVAG